MCVSLSLMSAGIQAGAAGTATPAQQTVGGGMMQAAAGGLGALSSLASGVVRYRAGQVDADATRAAGRQRAQRIRTAGQRELGETRGDALQAGVSLRSGSVLEAERQVVRNVEQDAGVAILNARSRAAAMEAEGRQELVTGTFGALAGFGMAADKWKRSRSAAVGVVPLGAGGGYVPIAGE
jgi:hypothetical protein